MDIPEESNSSAQSRRSKEGKAFEDMVFDDIEKSLVTGSPIQLLRPRTQTYPPGSTRQHKFSCLQVITGYGEVIGDTDIAVWKPKTKKVISIISCKTSVRERMMQSVGNLQLYKKAHGYTPELFFVTMDKDLEFGTDKDPRKYRIIAQYLGIPVYSTNPLTSFTGMIYPYSQMITDLKRISGMKP